MIRIATALLLVSSSIPSAVHAEKLNKQAQKYLAMTPADFEACVSIKDDSLDTVAVFSTAPCFVEKRGLLGLTWNDNFFRAFVDKKSGDATVQLYQYISYQGEWRFYNRVNYETLNGPESRELIEISRDVGGCSKYGGCLLSETMAFAVPVPLLRTIAGKYEPEAVMAWRFKYYSKSGLEWQDGIGAAEASGILRAIDAYRTSHGLPLDREG